MQTSNVNNIHISIRRIDLNKYLEKLIIKSLLNNVLFIWVLD